MHLKPEPPPFVLVADDELPNRLFVRRVLELDGWTVVEATDGAEAVYVATQQILSLVLMDLQMPTMDGIAATRAIRALNNPTASVPILAYTTRRFSDLAELSTAGLDGRVPKPCTPEELVEALRPWRPAGTLDGVRRLSTVFSPDEIARMVSTFRDQLVEAVERIDEADALALAHRIAGVAGTLGFAAVSASWLAFSEGDKSARDVAWREARLAIAAIDRDRQDGSAH